ncbi:MAG: hypothetical protein ACLTW9_27215 [Enterocloster sp.]
MFTTLTFCNPEREKPYDRQRELASRSAFRHATISIVLNGKRGSSEDTQRKKVLDAL